MQSAFYKGTNVRVSKREELQAKASLGRLAEVTYKSWISAFAGPEDSINLLAEDSEESGATRVFFASTHYFLPVPLLLSRLVLAPLRTLDPVCKQALHHAASNSSKFSPKPKTLIP